MSHQCVRCGEVYPDGDKGLLEGCSCGCKFFFFVRKKDMAKSRELSVKLTEEDRHHIERDVEDLVGSKISTGKPVFLDIESIRILKPGQYELDLVNLFKNKSLVYKLEDGKYIIDLVSTFKTSIK